MNAPLDKPPLEEDTCLKICRQIQINDYPAWYQKWAWDGIVGESVIFPAPSVRTLDDAALKALVVEAGYADADSRFTFARRDEWTFVNFNFRD